MKIFLHNYNTCTRVKLYGIDVKNTFIENGHTIVKNQNEADYILVNTCSFLKSKEDYFLKLIKTINQEKQENQKIVIIGCLASVNKPAILEINSEIITFGRDIDKIKEFFLLPKSPKAKASQVKDKLPFKKQVLYYFNKYILRSKHIEYRLKRSKVCYLQISTGCLGKCSYCSEKFTTKLKSRSVNEIIEAIKDGLQRGYTLFALNSDDASAYGRDIGTNLETLLSEVVKLEEKFSITIPEFNPQGITEGVEKLIANSKILYITVPIQSGSQKMLNSMRRPYKIEEVLPKLKRIKKANKNLKINTHVIVGFPGETKEDFEKTRQVLSTGVFDRVKVFMYSERPNTEAIKFEGKVGKEVKLERREQLLKVVKKNNIKHFSLTNLILNKDQLKWE